jgi:hypothetical protein
LSGSSGTSGESGTSGISGVNGNNGTSGTSGVSGTSGTSGSSGANGIDGVAGASGTKGTSGTSGATGASGTSGTSGTRGTSGSSGTSGVNGTAGTSGIGTSGTSGTSGEQGNKGGLLYTFSTTTSSGTASGTFRFNNGVIGSVTTVYINGTTTDGANVLSYISSAVNSTSTPKAFIIIESNTNGDNTYAIFSVTAVSTSTEVAYTVTYTSGTLPSNGEVCVISFDRTGNSSTNATAVSVTNANTTNSTFYPVFVTTDGSTQTLYVDKESTAPTSLSYNPSTAALYVGLGVASSVVGTGSFGFNYGIYSQIGGLSPGLTTDNVSGLLLGDVNAGGASTAFIGPSYVDCGQLTSGGFKFNSPTTYKQPTSNLAYGDVVYYGTGSSLTAGFIYYLNSSGVWTVANSNLASSSKFMLAIALGTNATSGMLVRGYAKYAVGNYASVTVGQILYLGTTNGYFQNTAPTSTAQVVRVIGYCVDATNDIIYFCPDNTWVEIA